MKRTLRYIIVAMVVLIVALAHTSCAKERIPEYHDTSTYTVDGNYVYFGSYPKTIKSEDVTVSEDPNSQGYYLGSDGCYYAQAVANNGKYMHLSYMARELYFKFSDGHTVESGETYYFKLEPIKWEIVSSSSDKVLLVAQDVLDAFTLSEEQDLNYESSSLRKWLNEDFFNAAFSESQKELIYSRVVSDDAVGLPADYDKVFLLSHQELVSTAYGYSYSDEVLDACRSKEPTDFGIVKGASINCHKLDFGEGNSTYTIRPEKNDTSFSIITSYGEIKTGYSGGTRGVVPALVLQLEGKAGNAQKCSEHQWMDWVAYRTVTCSVSGPQSRVCAVCFRNENRDAVLEHVFEESDTVTVYATCTENGKIERTCTLCNNVYSTIIEATGHLYAAYITTPATCTSDAYRSATCQKCGGIDTIVTAQTALGHNYQEGGRCDRCQAMDPALVVSSIVITNRTYWVEVGQSTQVTFSVYPSTAIYEKVSYQTTEDNTCNATITQEGVLVCGKVGRVTVLVIVDNEITAEATFYAY